MNVLTVWQSKQLVVIQKTVEIFYPLRIHVTVENDPVTLATLSTHIIDDLTQYVREESICPLSCGGIKRTKQLVFADSL
jgi:hypothetical protein